MKRSQSRKRTVSLSGMAVLAVVFLVVLGVRPALAVTITGYYVPTANSILSLITAGPDGNLWFTELYGDNIGKVTPTGVFTEYRVPTAASGPTGITVGPDGNLWFTEFYGDNIGKVTPTGVFTEYRVPTAASSPTGITVGPDGNLWFTEQYASVVGKVTTSGVFTEYTVPVVAPFLITPGPDGNLWFTSSAEQIIGKVTTSGVFTEYHVPTSIPSDITSGPDGNLWFTEQYAVAKITTSGVITEYQLPSSGGLPFGITAGPDGDLWFTEQYASVIGKATTSGVITEYPLPSSRAFPVGIAAGSDGNLWFTEMESNQIGELVPMASTKTVVLCTLSIVPVDQTIFCSVRVIDISSLPTSPTGTVTFMASSSGAFNPSNSCMLSSVSISASRCFVRYTPNPGSEGIHTIAGTYKGDSDFSGSSGSTTITVIQRATKTTVSCDTGSLPVDAPTNCVATVSDISFGTPLNPGGDVTWTSSGSGSFNPIKCTLQPLSSANSSCPMNYTPHPGSEGTHTITGTYLGDTDHTESTGSFGLTATKRSTSTSVSCSNIRAFAFSCAATVSDTSPGGPLTPTGAVTWNSGGVGIFISSACTPMASTLVCTVFYANPGRPMTVTMTATYPGDTDHFGSSGSTTITT